MDHSDQTIPRGAAAGRSHPSNSLMEPLPAPICSSYNKQGTPKTGVKRSKLDRKTGHTSKHCVHTATLLKIYIYIYVF